MFPSWILTDAGSLDNLNLTRSDPLMAAHFVTKRRVEFSDTDMAGIIHFASYYRYMEEAEHQFFRSLGLTVMQKVDDHTVLGWPRVSANCTFEAPQRSKGSGLFSRQLHNAATAVISWIFISVLLQILPSFFEVG
jgi:YbgC/YbaW family acyl-CoA thioester hydrolase